MMSRFVDVDVDDDDDDDDDDDLRILTVMLRRFSIHKQKESWVLLKKIGYSWC